MTVSSNRSGFTLVELLIVIVVIAILAAITTVAYQGISQRATASKASSTVNALVKGLESYYVIEGHYPGVKKASDPLQEGCIGKVSDYPASDGMAAGECAPSIDGTGMTSVNTTVTNELKKIMSIPDTSLPAIDDPWESGKTRGIYFQTAIFGGPWFYMQYALDGNQTCMSRMDKSYVTSKDETVCYVYLYGHTSS